MKLSAIAGIALTLASAAVASTIFSSCSTITTNTIGTNVLATIAYSNGTVVVQGQFDTNQLNTVARQAGTNCAPIQVIGN